MSDAKNRMGQILTIIMIDERRQGLSNCTWSRWCVLSFLAGIACYIIYSLTTVPVALPSVSLRHELPCNCQFAGNEVPKKYHDPEVSSQNLDKQRLFYNRVPKCGSTTLYTLMRKLASANNYVHYNSKVYDKRMINQSEQRRLVHRIKRTPAPCSFDRHVFYIDFNKFDETPPSYINLIRDPVERIISSYFYRRVVARQQRKPVREKPSDYWMNKKFEKCVTTPDPECTFLDGESYGVLQLPYFCGQDPHCRLLNDPWALCQAKHNIESSYVVVGILEELNATLQVLESTLPQFFQGALKMYRSLGVHQNHNPHKPNISEEVKSILKANLTAEYELYNFALQRLHKQYQQLKMVPKYSIEDKVEYQNDIYDVENI